MATTEKPTEPTAATPPAPTPAAASAAPAEPVAAVKPAPARARLTFTAEQRELIRSQCCTDKVDPSNTATDDEFDAFMVTCERLQLDPLARQIHFLKRGAAGKKVGRAETSIDGLRLVAERTGKYAGQTGREWCAAVIDSRTGAASLTWYEVWPFPTKGQGSKQPLAARVGVYRAGFKEPLYAVARFEAYKQTKYGGELNAMWEKMGPEQLAKCAEALALRQAFPNELSGIYTSDEMAQSEPDAEGAQSSTARAARTQGRQTSARQSGTKATPKPLHALAFPEDVVPDVPVFPYGALRRVPLHAKHTDETATSPELVGTYVVPEAKLLEAEQKAGRRMDAIRDKPEYEGEQVALAAALDELAAELTRRSDPASSAAFDESAEDDGPPDQDPNNGDESGGEPEPGQ